MYYNDYNRLNEPYTTEDYLVDGKPPKKKRTGLKMAALCLVFALLGGVAGGAAVTFLPQPAASADPPADSTTIHEGQHPPVVVGVSSSTTNEPMTGAQVYAANVGSAVGITTELITTNFWGQRVPSAAAGSGFVISSDGYILTNYHVIDGATSIQVAFVDGTTYPATLIGGEEANDIAVLKIEATGLVPVKLGDSDNLVVGEQVCAIGNPLGELTFTFTAGCVSVRDRSITMSDGTIMNMLQTDTAINSGNSGGPLFNMFGEVIGITTAKYSSSSSSSSASIEGIGFAIPINDVKRMVTDIMEKGYVTGKPHVGVLLNNVSTTAQRYGIPAGAEIMALLEGSCGEKAGLQVGDIITGVDESLITSSEQLTSAVKNYQAGDRVTFSVYRSGETLKVDVILDEYDTSRAQAMQELQQRYNEAQQQQQSQQQQQQGGTYWSWPFGFGW